MVGGLVVPSTATAQRSIIERILDSIPPFSWQRDRQPANVAPVPMELVQQLIVANGRNWGPEQVTGRPDTPIAGDQTTAWASLTQDGQNEWLELTYDRAVVPKKVEIHETFNPGAVYKITVFDGREESVVWEGKDPTAAGRAMGVSTIDVTTDVETNRIRVYLKSIDIAGWNEIDAVALVDANGKKQWADKVTASSTFAEAVAFPVIGGLFPLAGDEAVAVSDDELADVGRLMKDQELQMGKLVRQLRESRAENEQLKSHLEASKAELARLQELVKRLQKKDQP
jgi:hypothetical protein